MGRVSRAKSLESLTLNRSKLHYPINKQNRNPIRKFLYEIYYRIKYANTANILRAHQTEARNLIVPDQCSEACLQNVVDNSHCIYTVYIVYAYEYFIWWVWWFDLQKYNFIISTLKKVKNLRTELLNVLPNFNSFNWSTWDTTLNLDKVQTFWGATTVDTKQGENSVHANKHWDNYLSSRKKGGKDANSNARKV